MPEGEAPLPLRALLAADARRSRALQQSRFGYAPRSWWLDPGFVAVLLFRLSHAAHRRGGGKRARLLMQLNSLLTGADFHPAASIGPGLLVPSPFSTNLSCDAGARLTLMGQAGIGGSNARIDVGAGPGLPLLGNDVRAERFFGINGPFVYADGARVVAGAGAVRGAAAGETLRPTVDPEVRLRTPECAAPPVPRPPCQHRCLAATLEDWRADIRHYLAEENRYDPRPASFARKLSAAMTNPLTALLIQRLAHWLDCNGWRRFARLLTGVNLLAWKLTMPPETCLGGGVLLPHLAGIVVEGRLGAQVTLYANTVCSGWGAQPGTGPMIGDGVTVGGHSGVIGPVTLGRDVHLSPKVQFAGDAPEGTQLFSRSAYSRSTAEHEPEPMPHPDFSPPDEQPLTQILAGDRTRIQAFRAAGGRIGLFARTAVRLHRYAHDRYARGKCRRARMAWLANCYLTGADISPASRIGSGFIAPYPAGLVFHGCAGSELTMMAMCGVGASLDAEDRLSPLAAAPWLGDRVRLDHHAQVDGAVRIGDDGRIMPGCNARTDLPAGHELAMYPTRQRRSGAPETVARR